MQIVGFPMWRLISYECNKYQLYENVAQFSAPLILYEIAIKAICGHSVVSRVSELGIYLPQFANLVMSILTEIKLCRSF